MNPRRTPVGFLKKCWLEILFIVALSLCPAYAAELQIVQDKDAYVGQEVILSLKGMDPSYPPLVEWIISGDVKPVILKNAGMVCAFTPTHVSAIDIEVFARDGSGQSLASAALTLTPRYFDVKIEMLEGDPLTIWDIQAKEERPTSELASSRPIRFKAHLIPSYNGDVRYVWGSDASTSILSNDLSAEIAMVRSEIGDSELSVEAFNSAGVSLGSTSRTVSVTIPASRLEDFARQKAGWLDWQKAQSLWKQNRYAEAMELAQRSAAKVPEDTSITGEFKVMSANYERVLRSLELQERGSALMKEDQLTEALKVYRRARVVWLMPEVDARINELEEAINAIRLQHQRAEWLKDTASAYDQEGFLQEALDYYNQSQALLSTQPVEDRIARISKRLALIAKADKLAGEGNSLERNGKLTEAVESYKASLESNPDAALSQHVKELEEIIAQRKRQAVALLREGSDLQKKKRDSEALLRYRESMAMWASSDAQKRIEALEKTAQIPEGSVIRAPEDFGIGTKADAARFLHAGNTLYGEKRYREALTQYRKSHSISKNPILSELIRKLEASLKEYEAIQSANALIKEANLLYNQEKIQEAAVKYRESLAAHPNAEVEAFLRHIEDALSASSDISSDRQGE